MLSQSKDLPIPALNSIDFLLIKVTYEWKQKIKPETLFKILFALIFCIFIPNNMFQSMKI